MSGILRNYLISSKLSWAVRIIVPLFVFLSVFIVDDFTASNLLTVLTLGIWVNMGVNTRLRRFYTIMPISPRVFVLSDYLHNIFSILFGTAIAIVTALVKPIDSWAAAMYILFVMGMYIALCSFEAITKYISGGRWYLQAIIGVGLAIALLYLIFEAAIIHQLVRNIIAREPALEAQIFANTLRMLIFTTTSVCLYVLSYFLALAVHKKNDYVDMMWWM